MDLNLDTAISAAGGAVSGIGIAGAIAKWAISKALGDLEKLTSAVGLMREKLAEFTVRLEKISEHDALLKEHSLKHAFYEGRGCKTDGKR